MLTHVVCFKFADFDAAAEAGRRLRAMKGRIPTLVYIDAGVDVTRNDRSYDLALVTRFIGKAGLDAYEVHPVHQEVVAYIKTVAEATVAVDFVS
jgi:hypothetical protein